VNKYSILDNIYTVQLSNSGLYQITKVEKISDTNRLVVLYKEIKDVKTSLCLYEYLASFSFICIVKLIRWKSIQSIVNCVIFRYLTSVYKRSSKTSLHRKSFNIRIHI